MCYHNDVEDMAIELVECKTYFFELELKITNSFD